jgi:hypothetical protein
LEKPRLDCQVTKTDAQTWQVRVKTDRFMKSLALLEPPTGSTLTENYFDLDANREMMLAIKGLPATQSLKGQDLVWKWLV